MKVFNWILAIAWLGIFIAVLSGFEPSDSAVTIVYLVVFMLSVERAIEWEG